MIVISRLQLITQWWSLQRQDRPK